MYNNILHKLNSSKGVNCMRYYAVKKGHQTGVFDNWTECQNATKGFSGAVFNKFNTKEEAEAYLLDRDIWKEKVAKDNSEGYLVAFVDGSYDKDLQRYSYGVVIIQPNGCEETICGHGSNKEYIATNNIIGEIFGVINAWDWAVSNGFDKIKIYHDYEGLSKWISGEWKAQNKTSQMYVNLFKAKYQDVLSIEFVKVPAHSNVSFNEKADQLAKSALKNRQRIAIQGDNWYSIPYFSDDDFQAFVEIITESDNDIKFTKNDYDSKNIYHFLLNADTVTVTLFKTGHHKLLVQGKNTFLFQVITTTIIELDESSKVEQILGSAYRIRVEREKVDKAYKPVELGLPANYPNSIKRLIKQSIINLDYYIESEDYSQYVFPALRALEGHIKYLIMIAGGTVSKNFSQFNRASPAAPYSYVASLTDLSKKSSIETCYNYYKSQRDTAFHFGDIIGLSDSTRLIDNKEEADEIIKKCIEMISTQV